MSSLLSGATEVSSTGVISLDNKTYSMFYHRKNENNLLGECESLYQINPWASTLPNVMNLLGRSKIGPHKENVYQPGIKT